MENESKQQQPSAEPQQAKAVGAAARLPYEAPTVEVIEVQTERGYAGSRAFNSP